MAEAMLELGTLPPGEQARVVLERFDALAAGEELVLRAGGTLREALKNLVTTRWGAFDWAPVAAGREGNRYWLRKRTAALRPSIDAFLSEDHRRCDALLTGAQAAAARGEDGEARTLFGAFDIGIRRHIAMEEDGFFAAVEERTGMKGQGPTEVMRGEHLEIRRLLERIAGLLAAGDLRGVAATIQSLIALMVEHNEKEEQMLYPLADEVLAGDVEAFLKRMVLY